MATIYSLICFGGKDGKTVTFTDAGDVVNLANHGLRDGTGVVFTDNAGNTLPTGLSKDTTYYAKSTGANTFTLYTTSALTTQVTFTGTGTGTHKVKSAYYVGLSDKSRWTVGGTEYIFDSLVAWSNARKTASTAYDTEICEIGMAWTDYMSSGIAYIFNAARFIVTTLVNGIRSDGFHNGNIGSGYIAINYTWTATTIGEFDGFTKAQELFPYSNLEVQYNSGSVIHNMIFWHKNASSYEANLQLTCSGARVENNIIIRGAYGIGNYDYQGSRVINNNIVIGCTTGINAGPGNYSFFYNNIVVGNTTNWPIKPSNILGAGGNAGESGNVPWDSGSTSITLNPAADFMVWDTANYYANCNLRPALATSPQVNSGVRFNGDFVGNFCHDMVAQERPSYNNGGAEVVDVGAYEFDLGYGAWPTSRTIDFSGLVAGSQVVIYTTATTTELARNNSTGTTYSYDAAASGVTVDYTVLKAGYAPIRVTGVALTAASTPVTVQQDLDRSYSAPSGLTFGTNVIVNVTSRVVTSLQVTVATTVQNWYSYLMDCWIASATNTTLKNVAFPVIPFGEASFTTTQGIEFSDGATSISKFKRDGFRYSSDAGVTATAIWAAILTLNTPAGQQVKYRQAPAGTITNAANTGPMDQLVQVYGDASHGNFDYRGHMVLRAPKVGWSQPKPDLVATYGNLVDGLFVAALEPLLQYATTDADIDAANLVLDNTAKTYTITAAHTMAELYQRAQWWANQDAQWDADIPLTTTDGSTFTQPATWAMTGVSYLTGGTLAGGSATLAAGTQGIAYNGVTMNLGAAGTYTFTMAGSCTVKVTPTAPSTYIFGSGTFNGTLTVNNMAAHAITIEIPAGVTTSTAGNTGGAITFSAPAIYQSVTVSGFSTTSRLQIYDTTSSTELYNGVPGATSYTWTDSVAAAATRAIRIRIADVVTVTAKEFIEANIGTCATAGAGKDISYLASQVADATYNSNGVNGPSIYATSGITFTDASPDRVNCNIAGGSVSWPTIYACFVYWNYTATGIANDFTYVSAPDTANYLLSGMKIRNTSATDLMVITGYGRDATSGSSKDIIDTAGSTGNIFMAPDHVVPYQTTGTYAITGDISTVLAAIPSASANASVILSDPKMLTVAKFLGLK